MNPESLKGQGWRICPKTKFLSYKPDDNSCAITYISCIKDRELQPVYSILALELWAEAGSDDLLDPDYRYSPLKGRLKLQFCFLN